MSLWKQLEEDLKTAMRARKELERETLRMVIAGFKNRRIELGRDLKDSEQLEVLRLAVKTRKDSADQYAKAGRTELAEKESAEVRVLEGYLPAQLSEDEARPQVQAIAAELGLSDPKQMGQLMKAVMQRLGDRVDGKLAQRLAGDVLRG
jgi:uncharacterized protein